MGFLLPICVRFLTNIMYARLPTHPDTYRHPVRHLATTTITTINNVITVPPTTTPNTITTTSTSPAPAAPPATHTNQRHHTSRQHHHHQHQHRTRWPPCWPLCRTNCPWHRCCCPPLLIRQRRHPLAARARARALCRSRHCHRRRCVRRCPVWPAFRRTI